MPESIQFSALIEPANEMLTVTAADAWAAMAQLEAMIASGSTITALVRMSTDEFGDRRVAQIPLPLTDRESSLVTIPRAEITRLQERAARSGWMRGYSFGYWRVEGFDDGRDHIPAYLADALNEWCPYPATETSSKADAELAAKDRR